MRIISSIQRKIVKRDHPSFAVRHLYANFPIINGNVGHVKLKLDNSQSLTRQSMTFGWGMKINDHATRARMMNERMKITL